MRAADGRYPVCVGAMAETVSDFHPLLCASYIKGQLGTQEHLAINLAGGLIVADLTPGGRSGCLVDKPHALDDVTAEN